MLHEPSAASSISIGPGAELCFRSASKGTPWPDAVVATNSSFPFHFTIVFCTVRGPQGTVSSQAEKVQGKGVVRAGESVIGERYVRFLLTAIERGVANVATGHE